MQADTQTAQDSGVAKIRALLLAARPGLAASARDLALEFKKPPKSPGEAIPDRSPAITTLIEKLKTLREAVEAVAVEGAVAVNARDLTVRALLETEQSLGKLAESYAAPDQASSTVLLAESVRLLKEARTTSATAGKALGIPWPLQ
jgi:hypothetical protein